MDRRRNKRGRIKNEAKSEKAQDLRRQNYSYSQIASMMNLKSRQMASYYSDPNLWSKNYKIRQARLKEARKIGTHTKQEWEEMKEKFDWKCVRCGEKPLKITKDHIKPIYQGGSDLISNIQPFCKKCNSSKSSDNKDWRVIHS